MTDDAFEPSEAEKHEMRGGLSRVVGALMRAWWLGMFSARSPQEQELLDEIDALVEDRSGGLSQPEATPLGLRVAPDARQKDDLVRITDEEYLSVFDDLVVRYKLMGRAYREGMVTATDPEQARQLEELEELLD